MGFTKRALEEQKFLKENYPKLWMKYDEYMGNMCISEEEFKNDRGIRDEVFKLIAVENCYDGRYCRYVLFRSDIPDEEGNAYPGYVVCTADII